MRTIARVADGGEQFGGGPVDRAGVDRIVQWERDRVDTEREPGRQGRSVGVGRVASNRCVAVGEVDDVEDRRGRRIALVGNDLIACIIEIEAG